jgi:hypothetical protein
MEESNTLHLSELPAEDSVLALGWPVRKSGPADPIPLVILV